VPQSAKGVNIGKEAKRDKMSFDKSVGWADCSLNPILGLCPNKCRLPDGRAYCYYSGERGLAYRFKQNPKLRLDLSVFDGLPRKPKRIFLCSTNDYWGSWIPDEWREAIRQKTQEYPQHTFQVLTKQPQNLVQFSPYPDNWWIGVTATNNKQYQSGLIGLAPIQAKIKFISFEPLLEHIDINSPYTFSEVDWVIIGRLTGFGRKYDPKLEWVEAIVKSCGEAGIPIFLKNNLREIWQDKLIQQFPQASFRKIEL